MNKDSSNVPSTSGSVEQTNHSQTQRDVSDYWTPERMRNAKPVTPTVSDSPSSRDYSPPEQMQNAKPAKPSSGNAQPPEQGQNVKPATPPVSDSPQGDYWTPERMRNAKPAMPTLPSSGGSSHSSGAR